MSVPSGTGVEYIGNEIYDTDCLKLMNEYFYGVRIFPGQDPTHVYVGWVTSQYHLHTKDFNLSKVRKASIVIVDDYDRPVEQYVHSHFQLVYIKIIFLSFNNKKSPFILFPSIKSSFLNIRILNIFQL
jgi:hypothetical protein